MTDDEIASNKDRQESLRRLCGELTEMQYNGKINSLLCIVITAANEVQSRAVLDTDNATLTLGAITMQQHDVISLIDIMRHARKIDDG